MMAVARTPIRVPARADLIVVRRDGSIGYGSFLGTAAEGEIFLHAANAYAHCLRILSFPPGCMSLRTSLAGFADCIESCYCTSVPQVRAVTMTLRALHDRMVNAQACGLQMLVPA